MATTQTRMSLPQLTVTLCVILAVSVNGFTPSSTVPSSRLFRSAASSTALNAAAVPNPFKKLPWNVKKEQEKQARRLRLERATLYRELGIAEDATYEEIVEATDALIAKAGGDLKKKVLIEVTKDKIFQIQLDERKAGLAEMEKDASAQSRFETEGDDDDAAAELSKKKVEWNGPAWTRGLIVKPNEEHRNGQIRLWGIITAMGWLIPPSVAYLGRFTWLVCIAQLTFRGMNRDEIEGGGMGMGFGGGGGGGTGHRKVAFLLGLTTWFVAAVLTYGLMPSWAKGLRYSSSLTFTVMNILFGVACSYLQPYKG